MSLDGRILIIPSVLIVPIIVSDSGESSPPTSGVVLVWLIEYTLLACTDNADYAPHKEAAPSHYIAFMSVVSQRTTASAKWRGLRQRPSQERRFSCAAP